MTKLALILLSAAGSALLALGCNSYDPDIGQAPFRCGTEDPRCPDGYVCDTGAEPQVCVREDSRLPDRPDAGPVVIDAAEFVCNDDSPLEPNNGVGDATVTPIPELASTYELVGLAVCPAGDTDVFRFRIDQTGKNAQVDIEFEALHGGLSIEIQNASGMPVAFGSAVGGDPNHFRATLPNAAVGTYHAQVQGSPGIENNYQINIVVTGP